MMASRDIPEELIVSDRSGVHALHKKVIAHTKAGEFQELIRIITTITHKHY